GGAVVGELRRGGRDGVRVVAGSAAESARTGLEATAGLHLLDVAADRRPLGQRGVANERGNEQPQRQGRAVVEQVAPAAPDAYLALQMALSADIVAQDRGQSRRVDNGVISAVDGAPARAGGDVELPGAVAALAADAVAAEQRCAVAVDAVGLRLDGVAVTEQ